MSLEKLAQEINNMPSQDHIQESTETTEQQTEQEQLFLNYGFGNIVNVIFIALTRNWEELDRNKILLNEVEIKAVNEATQPFMLMLSERLGIEAQQLNAIFVVAVILIPRIVDYVHINKKYEKKEKIEGKKHE
jgi:hypothetical protein